jgi:hypothetical protein
MPSDPYQQRASECLQFAKSSPKGEPHDSKEEHQMNPPEEFLKHAADCQRMAKFTRDPASRATWNRMAERWVDCAERFKRESAVHRPAGKRYRSAAAEDWQQA